jgi:hypothetical protein
MAQSRGVGRRGMEGNEGGNATGGSRDSLNAKGNFEFDRVIAIGRKEKRP